MKPRTGKPMPCEYCQTSVYVPLYRIASFRFCSRKCGGLATCRQSTSTCATCGVTFSHTASRANQAKYCSVICYNKGQLGRGLITYTCKHCGKEFRDAASHKRQFCSKACVGKETKKTWKPKYTTVRKAMLSRGLLTKCNRCGYSRVPQILGVHHIDRNRNNNDPKNLEVLCANCHSEEHSKHISHGFKE